METLLVFERLYEATGLKKQKDLAEFFEVSISSVSHNLRNGLVPPGWLVTLIRKKNINPHWIITGEDPKFLEGTTKWLNEFDTALSLVLSDSDRFMAQVESEQLIAELKRRLLTPDRGTDGSHIKQSSP